MNITIRKMNRYPWYKGTVDGYHFEAAVYDEPSVYGIGEGRISKLMVWDENKRQQCGNYFGAAIMNYDRGWDMKPQARKKSIIDKLVSYLEQIPKYNA